VLNQRWVLTKIIQYGGNMRKLFAALVCCAIVILQTQSFAETNNENFDFSLAHEFILNQTQSANLSESDNSDLLTINIDSAGLLKFDVITKNLSTTYFREDGTIIEVEISSRILLLPGKYFIQVSTEKISDDTSYQFFSSFIPADSIEESTQIKRIKNYKHQQFAYVLNLESSMALSLQSPNNFTQLSLYQADNTVLHKTNGVLEHNLEAGQYFILIKEPWRSDFPLHDVKILISESNILNDVDIALVPELKLNTKTQGRLNSFSDINYYKFTIPYGGQVNLAVDDFSTKQYQLFSETGENRGKLFEPPGNGLRTFLEKGNYILKISDLFTNKPFQDYDFTLISDQNRQDDYTDDPLYAQLVDKNTEFRGKIDYADDEDLVKINLDTRTHLEIKALLENNVDITVLVVNADTFQIKGRFQYNSESNETNLSKLNLDAGEYNIRVSGKPGSAQLGYELSFTEVDSDDGNETESQAVSIQLDDVNNGTFDYVNDYDFYKLSIDTSTLVKFNSDNLDSMIIHQLDEQGNWIFLSQNEFILQKGDYTFRFSNKYFSSENYQFSINNVVTKKLVLTHDVTLNVNSGTKNFVQLQIDNPGLLTYDSSTSRITIMDVLSGQSTSSFKLNKILIPGIYFLKIENQDDEEIMLGFDVVPQLSKNNSISIPDTSINKQYFGYFTIEDSARWIINNIHDAAFNFDLYKYKFSDTEIENRYDSTEDDFYEFYLTPGYYFITYNADNPSNKTIESVFIPSPDEAKSKEDDQQHFEDIEIGQTVNNLISYPDDVDNYSFQVTKFENIILSITDATLDFHLAESTGYETGSHKSLILEPNHLIFIGLSPGLYHIHVTGNVGSEYQLSMEKSNGTDNSNNTTTDARIINFDETINDNFIGVYDKDTFKFVVEEESVINVNFTIDSDNQDTSSYYTIISDSTFEKNELNENDSSLDSSYFGLQQSGKYRFNPGVYTIYAISSRLERTNYSLLLSKTEDLDSESDIIVNARSINNNSKLTSNLAHLNDLDIYRFELEKFTVVDFSISTLTTHIPIKYTMLDENLNFISSDKFSRKKPLSAGLYFILISPYGSIADYQISLQEPVITSIKNGDVINLTQEFTTDRLFLTTYFKITAEKNTLVHIRVPETYFNFALQNINSNSQVLYQNDGEQLEISDSIQFKRFTLILEKGEYIFEASAFGKIEIDQDPKIDVEFVETTDGTNNDFENALKGIYHGESLVNFSDFNDIDFYVTQFPTDGHIEIRKSDFTFNLYDENQALVEEIDCKHTTNATCYAVNMGKYYYSVSAKEAEFSPVVNLNVSFEPSIQNDTTLDLSQTVTDIIPIGTQYVQHKLSINTPSELQVDVDSHSPVLIWIINEDFSLIKAKSSRAKETTLSSTFHLNAGLYYLLLAPNNLLNEKEIHYDLNFNVIEKELISTRHINNEKKWWLSKNKNYDRNEYTVSPFDKKYFSPSWELNSAGITSETIQLIVEGVVIIRSVNLLTSEISSIVARSIETGDIIWSLQDDNELQGNTLAYSNGIIWSLHKERDGGFSIYLISPDTGNIIQHFSVEDIILSGESFSVVNNEVYAHDENGSIVKIDYLHQNHNILELLNEDDTYHGMPVFLKENILIPAISKLDYEQLMLIVDLAEFKNIERIPTNKFSVGLPSIDKFGLIKLEKDEIIRWSNSSVSKIDITNSNIVWSENANLSFSPLVSHNRIYAVDSRTNLTSFDILNGAKLWQLSSSGEFGQQQIKSIGLMHNVIFINNNFSIKAIDLATQTEIWKTTAQGNFYFASDRLVVNNGYILSAFDFGLNRLEITIEEDQDYYAEFPIEKRIRIKNEGDLEAKILGLTSESSKATILADYESDACNNIQPILSAGQSCTVIAGYHEIVDNEIFNVQLQSGLEENSQFTLNKSPLEQDKKKSSGLGCSIFKADGYSRDPIFFFVIILSIFYIIKSGYLRQAKS